MREIRISPDSNSVAIRSDNDQSAWNAWAVMNATNGGHWSAFNEVTEWETIQGDREELPQPEQPTPPVQPPGG